MLGISRRLDQLGRIVLPIEIRKKLKLDEGNLIDISINNDCVILRKTEPVKDLQFYIADVCSCLDDCDVVCTSESEVVYCKINGKLLQGGKIDDNFFNYASEFNGKKIESFVVYNDFAIKDKFVYCYSLSTYGDRYGCICFFYEQSASEKQIGIMNYITSYICGKL